MDPNTLGDEELARLTRKGDTDAFAELWARHSRAGLTAARQFGSIADPDDIVSEAFLRILRAFQRGGGPSEAFRPYLYRTIRNVALSWKPPIYPLSLDNVGQLEIEDSDPGIAIAENTITVRAFRTLPERWQTVLWYTEVEGMEPAEAAPLLGLAPNAVAALSYRARDGLKKAWLQAHVSDLRVPPECRWTTERMGEYTRNGLTRRAKARFEGHLAGCTRCSILLEEVDSLGGRLAVLLFPVVLGGSAGAALLADRPASSNQQASTLQSSEQPLAGTAAAPTAAGLSATALSGPTRLAVVGAAVTVIALTGVAGYAMDGGFAPAPPPTAPQAQEPTPTSPTSAPQPSRTPPPEPEPTPPPTAPPVPPAAPPSAPPTPPAVPVDTTPPAAPVVAAPLDAALLAVATPAFSGTGEPGGTVHLDLLGPDAATVLQRIGTTTVGADGTWSMVSAALTDGIQAVRVTQVDAAGNVSSAVTRTLTIDTIALPPVLEPLPPAPLYYLPVISGTAEPSGTVELKDELGGLLATAPVDAAGAWSIHLPDPLRDDLSVSAVQVDPAGNRSELSPALGPVVFERPTLTAPIEGETVPSAAGATSVTVRIAGIEGLQVQVFVDGVTTGNIHTLETDPIERVTVPLPDGAHTIGVRYFEPTTERAGSIASVAFTIG